MQKKYLIVIIFLIFILSIAVRYYPVFHKGYSSGIGIIELILARNLSLTNEYKMTDEKDILLSSSLVKEKGVPSPAANRLTPILYGKVFDIFGFNQATPLYVCLVLYGITTVLLFLLVLKLFNFSIALLFAGIDIFIPFVLAGSTWFGVYEWAMLFFIIAILIYLWEKKPGGWRLLLSGLFFGLAALARNAFLISFIPFVVYDWHSNVLSRYNWRSFQSWFWPTIKRGFIFVLPVILLWGGFMFQDYLAGRANEYLSPGDIGFDGHLFRDPYTYHFDRDDYIKEIQNTANAETVTYLKKYNYDITWKQHLLMYASSMKYYLNSFFRQPTIGGPLIIFLLILGAIYLFRTRRRLWSLMVFWLGILFFILIALKTTNDDHFLEVRFPLVLLISSGVYWIAIWLKQVIKSKKVYYWLIIGLFLVLFLHLIQVDKWLFHEKYLYSNVGKRLARVELVNKSGLEIGPDDVIAGGGLFLNYYNDFSCISFSPETIRKLLKENKLQWAFDQFGVTHALGFGDLNQEITNATNVKVIDF